MKKIGLFKFNGVSDWLLIRFTSIFSLLSILTILKFFFLTENITYNVWKNYFSLNYVKICLVFFLFNILIHTWIGIWQVITDYVNNNVLNMLIQILFFIFFISYIFYGINVIIKV